MKTPALLFALAVAAGCGDRDRHDDHAEHGAHADEHAAAPAPADGAGLLRIAPEMIRDLRITTTRAESRTAGERVSVLGELHVDEDTYAEVATPVTARVVKILARAGDRVSAGQTLAIVRSPDLGKARAELQAAAARVAIARQALERKRALVADRLAPAREVVEAEAALADVQAAHTVAAAAVRGFGAGAGDPGGVALRAPLAGTVIERDVFLGQLADPARTLFRIGDLSHLWLIAHVFERDAVRVRVGGKGSASFAALPGQTVDATITWIGGQVDPSSRTIPVRLDVPNPDGVLRPGMSASATLALGDDTGTVVAVPLAAVQRVGGAWVVFRPRGEGVFEVRAIGRGRDLAGEVEILSGLAPGDEVVVDGAFLLKAESDKASGEGGDEHEH